MTNDCGCPIGNCDCPIQQPSIAPHVDFGGQPIKPGALIIYPAQEGHRCVLKFAIVTRLERNEKWSVKRPTLRVISTTENGYVRGRGFVEEWTLYRDGKEITLQYPDRVMMVDKDEVPVRARELLLAAYNAWREADLKKAMKSARPAKEGL